MQILRKPKERLVVVGNGMAGIRAVEEILKRAPDRFDVTVFGAEPHVNYNRVLLSPLLAGEVSFDEIVTHDRAWYAAHGVTLFAGEAVTRIDPQARRVHGANGTRADYDVAIVATGSNPIVLPVPGANLPGVVTFRDVGDVRRMQEAARRHRRAVVVGGGLLGIEAATGLRAIGMDVTLVHLMPTLMERQLDAAAGALLRREIEARGIRVLTSANTTAILRGSRVNTVRLEDGELDANLVVMAVGIRPNVALARAAGLECRRGLVVDDAMRTSDPWIYAVGECVEHRGQTYGLVAPLFEMAAVCADCIARIGEAAYAGSVTSARLKVTGVELFSAGRFLEREAGDEDIVFRDTHHGVYKRIVVHDNRIKGAVLYGDARDAHWYLDMLRGGADVAPFREALPFGRTYAGAAAAA